MFPVVHLLDWVVSLGLTQQNHQTIALVGFMIGLLGLFARLVPHANLTDENSPEFVWTAFIYMVMGIAFGVFGAYALFLLILIIVILIFLGMFKH